MREYVALKAAREMAAERTRVAMERIDRALDRRQQARQQPMDKNMSELDEAAKSLAVLSKLLAPLIAVGPVLEKLGSLEKYLDKLEAKVEDAKKHESAAQQQLHAALRATEKAVADHEQRKRELVDELNRSRAETEVAIAQSIGAAERNAGQIIANARTEAAFIKTDADHHADSAARERDTARNELVKLDKEIAEKRQVAAKIKTTIEGFQAAL